MPHKVRYIITERSDGYIIFAGANISYFLERNISFHGTAVYVIRQRRYVITRQSEWHHGTAVHYSRK